MSADWHLEELGTIVTGKTPPQALEKAYSVLGTPFLTPKDMDGRKWITSTERYLSEAGVSSVKNSLIPAGSISVSCIGSDMGKAVMVPVDTVTNQQINSIIPDKTKCHPEYLYYLLSTKQQELKDIAGGSATPILNKGHFGKVQVHLPDIGYQAAAAKILSGFDEKIQLNQQINQTLEQMAQAIFKSWFVDFEPVKAKIAALEADGSEDDALLAAMQVISGKDPQQLTQLQTENPEHYATLRATAVLFPVAMQESELGEIPEGWKVTAINKVANIIKGKSYRSVELEPSKNALVTLKSFNRGGGYRLDGLKEYTGKYKDEQKVTAGDLIIAYTDVTQAADVIGKPALVIGDSRYENLIISLDVAVVRPFDKNFKPYLYGLAKTDSFQTHTGSYSTGTTVLHLAKDAVPDYQFTMPSNALVELYMRQVAPLFELIDQKIQEARSLEFIRDTLLPKLLSGELAIADAE